MSRFHDTTLSQLLVFVTYLLLALKSELLNYQRQNSRFDKNYMLDFGLSGAYRVALAYL